MIRGLLTFGNGGYANRRLHLLELETPEQIDEHPFAFDQHSAILLAWNETNLAIAPISHVSKVTLRQRAVSICCWGPDCELVHDVLDEIIAGDDPESSIYPQTIITTWHPRESFDEVLWYFLSCAIPEEQFESSCRDSLVITIGASEGAVRVRNVFSAPTLFLDKFSIADDHNPS